MRSFESLIKRNVVLSGMPSIHKTPRTVAGRWGARLSHADEARRVASIATANIGRSEDRRDTAVPLTTP